MEKVVTLKDGTEVIIRPLQKEDLDRSFAFFQELPPEDRAYLRVDVTRRRFVEQRMRNLDQKRIKRLAGVRGGRIVADGALELAAEEWKRHVAEIRLIVARAYQRKGMGMLMARELFLLAAQEKVQEILVRMMRPQMEAKKIFKRLGFYKEVVLPDYVLDQKGEKQDLILMRCDLGALWEEMKHYLTESDWQRTR